MVETQLLSSTCACCFCPLWAPNWGGGDQWDQWGGGGGEGQYYIISLPCTRPLNNWHGLVYPLFNLGWQWQVVSVARLQCRRVTLRVWSEEEEEAASR